MEILTPRTTGTKVSRRKMLIQIDNYNIKLHRASIPNEKDDSPKRLTVYVDAICELGKRYHSKNKSHEQCRKETPCLTL